MTRPYDLYYGDGVYVCLRASRLPVDVFHAEICTNLRMREGREVVASVPAYMRPELAEELRCTGQRTQAALDKTAPVRRWLVFYRLDGEGVGYDDWRPARRRRVRKKGRG